LVSLNEWRASIKTVCSTSIRFRPDFPAKVGASHPRGQFGAKGANLNRAFDLPAGRSSIMLVTRGLPTVLLVEDDPRVAQVLCRVLSRSGYEVHWADCVAAAEHHFDRAPDIALIDLHLPDGNGVDLATALHLRYSDLPMLLMTGCPFRLREKPNDARFFRQVLLKPLDLQQLRRAVSAALYEDAHADDQEACAC
jgi:CheY-like chemotaxis protein